MKRWTWLVSLFLSLSVGSQAFSATFPYSTRGRSIVDANGEVVHLKAVNWYGANLEAEVVAGLDHRPMREIARLIRELGFNAVRLPFSNAMIHTNRIVDPSAIKANPQLMGKTPLEVFDLTVKALADEDIAIMLNNHSTNSVWCCNYDLDGLWHFSGNSGRNQTEDEWISDWKFLVERYRYLPEVMGADLRNEVRTAKWGGSLLPLSPNWGSGDENDWARAAERAGNEILSIHPDILIIVEGINWTGTLSLLGGYRPHLMPVIDRAVQLKISGRLVYAAHNYGYVGPKHNGDSKTSPGQITYSEMDESAYFEQIEKEWGYVLESEKFYTAPVIVSEFGIGRDNPSEKDRVWFRRLVDYLTAKRLHFAYWPLNAESYGLVGDDWQKLNNDWREQDLKRLTTITPEPLDTSMQFASLNLQQGDQILSEKFGDWQAGAAKGTCPEGMMLVGLSSDHRALCREVSLNWENETKVIADYEETHVDWASGNTKYTCPQGFAAIGFSKRYWGTSGVLCQKAAGLNENRCRTLWFDRGDARSVERGGDFARGAFKGQCASDEYLSGIAQRKGKATAIRCCL